jgi:hypothetical protein
MTWGKGEKTAKETAHVIVEIARTIVAVLQEGFELKQNQRKHGKTLRHVGG